MRSIVAAFAVLALVLIALVATAGPGEGRHPKEGQEVPIAGSGARWAFAASPEVMEAWKDRPEEERRLRALGAMGGIESGRRVRLLSREGDLWRVKVLSGPRLGEIGWVSRAALGR